MSILLFLSLITIPVNILTTALGVRVLPGDSEF